MPSGLLTGVGRAEPTKAADTCRVALTRPHRRENFWPSGQAGGRSRRDEDAERRKLVQGEFVGKMFGCRITVVCWLAVMLLQSSSFLSSSLSAPAWIAKNFPTSPAHRPGWPR